MHRFRESIPDLRVDKAAGKIPAVFKERSMPYDEEKEKEAFRNPFALPVMLGFLIFVLSPGDQPGAERDGLQCNGGGNTFCRT